MADVSEHTAPLIDPNSPAAATGLPDAPDWILQSARNPLDPDAARIDMLMQAQAQRDRARSILDSIVAPARSMGELLTGRSENVGADIGNVGSMFIPVGKFGAAAAAGIGAAKPAIEAAAEAFRPALKALKPDSAEAVLQGIKEALGGDWDTAVNMPKAGSQWQAVPKATALTTPDEFAAHNPWAKGMTPKQFADHMVNKKWQPDAIASALGLSGDNYKDFPSMILPPEFSAEVQKNLPATVGFAAPGSLGQLSAYDMGISTVSPGNFHVVANGKPLAKLTYVPAAKAGGSASYSLSLPNGASKTVGSFNEAKDALVALHNKAASAPSLSDENIDSYLANNPGASIFDLSGVSKPEPKFEPIDTETLPHGAMWQLTPEKQAAASAQGYNVFAHHGTCSPVIFDEFRLPKDEVGVHFGSPRAAQEIQGQSLDWATNPRVYPSAIVAQNPFRMDDIGTWGPRKLANNMIKNGLPEDEVRGVQAQSVSPSRVAYHIGDDLTNWQRYNPSPGEEQLMTKNLRNYLQSKGYDSIVYKNKVEDAGHDSYILFRESPTSPGHVFGARLPWANFDPAHFKSANIAAGIPLAVGTGAYVAGHKGNLVPISDAQNNPFPQEQ